MSHIFPFVTCQPNPIGGCSSGNYWGDEDFRLCSFDCIYCWAKNLKNRFKYPKYQGPWRIIESELKQYKPQDFPWICDMIDMGDPTIPKAVILRLLNWIGEQSCPVLLLTKNPFFYRVYRDYIPPNAVLGATIESNDPATLYKISQAPSPWQRLDYMQWCARNLPNKRFICVEPIIKFYSGFADRLRNIEPWAYAVGYDNYICHLPEPTLAETEKLIGELEQFTTVYRKSIRPAWEEKDSIRKWRMK